MMGGGSEQQWEVYRETQWGMEKWKSGPQRYPLISRKVPQSSRPAGDRQGPSSVSLNEARELGDPGAGGPRESAHPAALGPPH